MAISFKKATRTQAKLRLALVGTSGSGKTYTALLLAKHLGKRIAVIDSEFGSASKYAGYVCDFDVLELDTYAPRNYVEAIKAAEQAGYDVIVVDSLSHAWAGKGGALEMVDNATRRSKSGNSYTAWRDVTPEHNALVDAMVMCKAHLLATMRAKTEYVLQEGSNGKKTPQKVGMAPVQREGLDFEFDVVAEMDQDHNFIVTKTRCPMLDGVVANRPGEQIADKLKTWLSDGAPAPVKPAQEVAPQQRPFVSSPTASGANTNSQTTAPGGTPAAPDEFGITPPPSPCPRVSAQAKDHPGKLWTEVPEWMVTNWLEKNSDRMSEAQVEWATYIATRRQARKAQEAKQTAALDAAGDGGSWVAGDDAPTGDPEPGLGGEQTGGAT